MLAQCMKTNSFLNNIHSFGIRFLLPFSRDFSTSIIISRMNLNNSCILNPVCYSISNLAVNMNAVSSSNNRNLSIITDIIPFSGIPKTPLSRFVCHADNPFTGSDYRRPVQLLHFSKDAFLCNAIQTLFFHPRRQYLVSVNPQQLQIL